MLWLQYLTEAVRQPAASASACLVQEASKYDGMTISPATACCTHCQACLVVTALKPSACLVRRHICSTRSAHNLRAEVRSESVRSTAVLPLALAAAPGAHPNSCREQPHSLWTWRIPSLLNAASNFLQQLIHPGDERFYSSMSCQCTASICSDSVTAARCASDLERTAWTHVSTMARLQTSVSEG